MGRFINGDRPRSSPRLNLVKPARFDADHKELVNGVKKEETEVNKDAKDEKEDALKKRTKKSRKLQPIRRSSRKIVLMKTKSSGVVTRSHRRQNGQKQPNTPPPHKNGIKTETATAKYNEEKNVLLVEVKEREKVQAEESPKLQPLRRSLQNTSPSKKKFAEMEEQKVEKTSSWVLRSHSKNR